MYRESQVHLFRNGQNQAIHIPREFEFDAQEAIMRREDGRLVIEPVRKKGLLATLAMLEPLDVEFPDMDAGLPPLDDLSL